ncbi:MAG: AAA family ATPase [Patescibacteria group bacterium]
MNLLFIYGAPGVGKLTVAQELSKLTGYKIAHNHLAQDLVTSIFEWKHPERKRLARKFRLELFEAAAKENISLITTYASVGEGYNEFLDDIISSVERYNGHVYLVKLECSEKELHKRVINESRKKYNKLNTIESVTEKMKEIDYSQLFPQKKTFIIDNTSLSADKVAQMIVEHYKL